MNTQAHRLIFNKSRGCMMAVAETASSCSKSPSGTSKARRRSSKCPKSAKSDGFTLSKAPPDQWIRAQAANNLIADCASQTSDGRMQALAAASTALNVYNNAKDIGQAMADPVGSASINVSIGTSKSQSNSSSQSDTARGSTIGAGNNINITVTGDSTNSNILIQGSDVKAANTTTLTANNQINLLAAKNESSQTSTNSNSSSSIGASFSAQGINATASFSRSNGKSDGQDTSFTNTNITAGNTATIKSGGDTNVIGATVQANQIKADIGGSLKIESLQDKSSYTSNQKSIGASISIPITASGSAGGSVSASKSNVESNLQSVGQQSGLKAGDGGFQVSVNNNTALTGGVISSNQQAINDNKNTFTTGGALSITDIQNTASFKGTAVGGTIGVGSELGKSGAGVGNKSGNASITSSAGISGIAGNTAVRTGDAETGLRPIFDAEKVQKDINAQVAITQTFTKESGKAADTYFANQRQQLQERLKQATTDEQKQQAQQALKDLVLQERVINILIGAVTGNAVSAVTKEGLSAAANEMRQLMTADSRKFAGVTDGVKELTNMSGLSEGVRGDGVKIGGTRVDLDLLCGASNERCETNTDGTLLLNEKAQVKFLPENASGLSLAEFIKSIDGQKMSGATGGIQGAKGTLFGIPYAPGSWQDKLIEAFSGTHDMIGGKLSGLYDQPGNIKRGMTADERATYDKFISTSAIVPSIPFAAAELVPSPVWNAISILLKGAK